MFLEVCSDHVRGLRLKSDFILHNVSDAYAGHGQKVVGKHLYRQFFKSESILRNVGRAVEKFDQIMQMMFRQKMNSP